MGSLVGSVDRTVGSVCGFGDGFISGKCRLYSRKCLWVKAHCGVRGGRAELLEAIRKSEITREVC
jgi:hypothetical protein